MSGPALATKPQDPGKGQRNAPTQICLQTACSQLGQQGEKQHAGFAADAAAAAVAAAVKMQFLLQVGLLVRSCILNPFLLLLPAFGSEL